MAAEQVRIKIGGEKLANVLDVSFAVDVAPDANGAPVDDRPRLGRIVIERRSDSTTSLWDWAAHPGSEDWKSGTIEYLNPQKTDEVMRTVEWQDGFVASYTETVPDIDQDRNSPVKETVEISARVLKIGDVEIVAYEVT